MRSRFLSWLDAQLAERRKRQKAALDLPADTDEQRQQIQFTVWWEEAQHQILTAAKAEILKGDDADDGA